MGIGIVLIVLGLASAAVVVDLLIENPPAGSMELTVFGVTGVRVPLSTAVVLAASLAAAAVLFVALGIAMAVWARRRARAEARTDAYTRTAGLEARSRLLEFRLKDLQSKVHELEQTREEMIRQSQPTRHTRPARRVAGSERSPERLVVLPDTGPSDQRAGAAPVDRPPADPPSEGT